MQPKPKETVNKKKPRLFRATFPAYLAAICLALTAAAAFYACGDKPPGYGPSSADASHGSGPEKESLTPGEDSRAPSSEASSHTEESDVLPPEEPFIYNAAYVKERLGENFSVTYQITRYLEDFSTEKSTFAFARDKTGFFIETEDISYMYIEDGEGYFICAKDDFTGAYVKIPGVQVPAEEVESVFLGALYPFFHDARQKGLKSAGPAFVCGRRCEKYLLDASLRRSDTDMEFFIDDELDICLKYTCFSPPSGENGGIDYECTELRLSGAALPPYEG